jgi:hypothetical protein
MSDIVKASIIIGIAIIISQGLFEIEHTGLQNNVVKMNKLTGQSEICFAGAKEIACTPHKFAPR